MTKERTAGKRQRGGARTARAARRGRALADEELLAILVGANGVDAVGALLGACGTVQHLAQESTGDLARVEGMTPARAAMVVAGVEPGRRTLTRSRPDQRRLVALREVAELLLPSYGASPVERFGIATLSAKHRVLRTEIVSTGTLGVTLVHPRKVFWTAATCRAATIVFFLDHPTATPPRASTTPP